MPSAPGRKCAERTLDNSMNIQTQEHCFDRLQVYTRFYLVTPSGVARSDKNNKQGENRDVAKSTHLAGWPVPDCTQRQCQCQLDRQHDSGGNGSQPFGIRSAHDHFLDLGGHRRHRLRSEEHTSELQSRENLVCRLLLEKKKSLNLMT